MVGDASEENWAGTELFKFLARRIDDNELL